MLLLAFLLLPVALAVERHVQFRDHDHDYDLTFEYNTLKNIAVSGQPYHLDLSNLTFKYMDPQAFVNLSSLKVLSLAGKSFEDFPVSVLAILNNLEELDLSNNNLSYGFSSNKIENVFANKTKLTTLNLANNSISHIPESVISIFPNLEHLNVADNSISERLEYERLGRLKTLDISNNPIGELTSGYFFGLSKNITVTTRGVELSFMSGRMFENVKTASLGSLRGRRNLPTMSERSELYRRKRSHFTPAIEDPHGNTISLVCIVSGRLMSLKNFDDTITTKENCKKYEGQFEKTISLRDSHIETFNENWYRLRIDEFLTLDLDKNEIHHITEEMLNDLPPEIVGVSLQGNMIERLEKGVIENENPMKLLDLSHNNIGEIAEGALEKLNLVGTLKLNNNRLRDMKFVDSLPSNLEHFIFHDNEISKLAGNLSKFENLKEIDLSHNKIMKLNAQSLRGLSSLHTLELSNNGLRDIEPDCFKDLTRLRYLYLENNNLSSLPKGSFDGLKNIWSIYLDHNKFTDIADGVFSGLPGFMRSLDLNNNEIRILKSGAFVKVPTESPDLGNKKIMRLNAQSLRGFSSLEGLSLSNNGMMVIEPGCFESLTNLLFLRLENNNLSSLAKGSFDGLNNIQSIDLHHNKLTEIADGVFSGLPDTLRSLYLNNNEIRTLKSGAFIKVPTENPDLGNKTIMRLNTQSLRGLSSLDILDLSNNGLMDIEPGCFKDLTRLSNLHLEYNNLSSLPKGLFDGLKNIRSIYLHHNKLTEIADGVFSGLPGTLRTLYLNYNEIRILKSGAFVKVPKIELYLDYNNITDIESRCFDLPNLDQLFLQGNSLKRIRNDTFQGLGSVTKLDLSSNRIMTIEKGAIRDMGTLRELDLAENRIEVLENGALFAQSKTAGIDLRIKIYNNSIETIQGGVFDDV